MQDTRSTKRLGSLLLAMLAAFALSLTVAIVASAWPSRTSSPPKIVLDVGGDGHGQSGTAPRPSGRGY
ncbi:hypothetical protein ABT294_11235 [Nonomuraea sp. NPDC000554]|uniref:hypothetical protein n=1 Tax=Nonomuraea sp. NPDC000554 TaxID=3154259 RepID=UPI0033186226